VKRWTLRILVCLILGAVTTVAVAWGCAAWSNLPDEHMLLGDALFGFQGYPPSRFAIGQRVGFGRTDISTSQSFSAGKIRGYWARDQKLTWITQENLDESLSGFTLPTWSQLGPTGRTEPTFVQYEEATGFPFRSMWGAARDWVIDSATGEWVMRPFPPSAIHFSSWRLVRWSRQVPWTGQIESDEISERLLPLVPIWPGFLINTLSYAAIWFTLFFGFGSAKRAIRRKRGRCPRCGYDLRGALENGCSECGWRREEKAP